MMLKYVLPVVFGLFQVLRANKPTEKLCVRANEMCEKDIFMCGFAYLRFTKACGLNLKAKATRGSQNWTHLQPLKSQSCSKECVEAIHALKDTKVGKKLHECDCQLDGDCLIVKSRVAKCLNTTKQDGPYVSCTMAMRNCTMDPTCKFLQGKFLEDCREMFNGVRCDEKCLRIQERLFRSTHGKALSHCECDGPTEAFCRGLHANAEQLRCKPGMDGNGLPAFTYFSTNDSNIYGRGIGETTLKNTSAKFHPAWTLVVLIFLTSFVLSLFSR